MLIHVLAFGSLWSATLSFGDHLSGCVRGHRRELLLGLVVDHLKLAATTFFASFAVPFDEVANPTNKQLEQTFYAALHLAWAIISDVQRKKKQFLPLGGVEVTPLFDILLWLV